MYWCMLYCVTSPRFMPGWVAVSSLASAAIQCQLGVGTPKGCCIRVRGQLNRRPAHTGELMYSQESTKKPVEE